MFQKKAPHNIFIIKSQNLKMEGGGDLGVQIKLMNQNFSKSKILHESSELEHCQWGGGGEFWGYKFRGGDFGPLKSLGFQQLLYL